MKLTGLLFAASLTILSSACDRSTEGAHGNVRFTPGKCGNTSCDFADSIGVGGKVQMNIEGNEGVSTVGVTIESDDSDVLTIVAIADSAGKPTWELQALSEGMARLTVKTQGNKTLDYLEVDTVEVGGLTAHNVLGDAVGPASGDQHDQVWTINADQAVSFQVTAYVGDKKPVMGIYEYTGAIDEEIDDGLVSDDISGGYLYFSVPEGEYQASFEDDFGHAIDLLFIAQAPSA